MHDLGRRARVAKKPWKPTVTVVPWGILGQVGAKPYKPDHGACVACRARTRDARATPEECTGCMWLSLAWCSGRCAGLGCRTLLPKNRIAVRLEASEPTESRPSRTSRQLGEPGLGALWRITMGRTCFCSGRSHLKAGLRRRAEWQTHTVSFAVAMPADPRGI